MTLPGPGDGRRAFILGLVLLVGPACRTDRSERTAHDGATRETVRAPVAEQTIAERLAALPGVEITEIESSDHFTRAFEIRVEQPVDHGDPDAGIFTQRLFLSHVGADRPMVLDTEGYAVPSNRTKELSRLLRSNQLLVEHRYFGESCPEPLDWHRLTVAQAAADDHHIVDLFDELYPGPWVSSGFSKGGQTALFFRALYPEDVDATVAYVAPINQAVEEPRIHEFLAGVGDQGCRERIADFQLLALEHRDELVPMIAERAHEQGWTFSIGNAVAFEYAVLEYPFSFWQYSAADCGAIPQPGASAAEIFESLSAVVSLWWFCDEGMAALRPFFYQAYTEIGYYSYPLSPRLAESLVAAPDPSNRIFAPQGVPLTYQPETMRRIKQWLETEGARIVYIYGERDPWSASAVRPDEVLDAVVAVKPGGSHNTNIASLPDAERERVLGALERWLGVDLGVQNAESASESATESETEEEQATDLFRRARFPAAPRERRIDEHPAAETGSDQEGLPRQGPGAGQGGHGARDRGAALFRDHVEDPRAGDPAAGLRAGLGRRPAPALGDVALERPAHPELLSGPLVTVLQRGAGCSATPLRRDPRARCRARRHLAADSREERRGRAQAPACLSGPRGSRQRLCVRARSGLHPAVRSAGDLPWLRHRSGRGQR